MYGAAGLVHLSVMGQRRDGDSIFEVRYLFVSSPLLRRRRSR